MLWIYVHVYVYVHAYVCVYIYISLHIHVHNICMYVDIHIYIYVYTRTRYRPFRPLCDCGAELGKGCAKRRFQVLSASRCRGPWGSRSLLEANDGGVPREPNMT